METKQAVDAVQLALADYLEVDPSEIELETYDHYGLSVYSLGNQEYAIGADDEADEAVKLYIKDTAWAFNSAFLAGFTGLPEEVFIALQDKCEDSNDAILKLVQRSDRGLSEFIEDAVACDGRGHFLSSYDGCECDNREFFIYRIN